MKLVLSLSLGALASCSSLPSSARTSASLAPAPLVVATAATTPSAIASPAHGNRLTLYVGRRKLDDDYDPVETQDTLALEFSQEHSGSLIGWEFGFAGSSDEGKALGFDVEASTGEVYAGLRKSFGDGEVRPYLGAGVSFVKSELDTPAGDFDDTSVAGYAHGGIVFDASEKFFIGLDLRTLFGSSLDLGPADTDADYVQLAVFLGFRF